MRPIDADALKKLLLEERDKIPLEVVERYSVGIPSPYKHGQSMRGGIRKALRCLEKTPTLDYAPVVHGEWGEYEAPYGFPSLNGFPCSVCDMHQVDIRGLYYCPNCGAKMDGNDDDHDP